jgi:hypothetical protein
MTDHRTCTMRTPPFSGQKGEDEYKSYFTQNAPKQASFAEATRQAQQLLSTVLNTR